VTNQIKRIITRIVNIKNEGYDILIARPSKWGNPYTHIRDKETLAQFVVDSREEAIQKYREHILNSPKLLECLHELEGKVLGCWCKPDSCHGDILLELLTQIKLNKFLK
jgi:hypothetical protein